MFVKDQGLKYISRIGWGLIFESSLTGLGILLPYNLHSHMKELAFADMQISLTYYLAVTPGNLGGIILGLFLLFLVCEIEKKQNL